MRMVSVKAPDMSQIVLWPDAVAARDTDPCLVILKEREEFHSYNSVCIDEEGSIRRGCMYGADNVRCDKTFRLFNGGGWVAASSFS